MRCWSLIRSAETLCTVPLHSGVVFASHAEKRMETGCPGSTSSMLAGATMPVDHEPVLFRNNQHDGLAGTDHAADVWTARSWTSPDWERGFRSAQAGPASLSSARRVRPPCHRVRAVPRLPPVWCCTFLGLLSTTTVPDAITAPASEVVAAKAPTPPTSTTQTVSHSRTLPGCLRRISPERTPSRNLEV